MKANYALVTAVCVLLSGCGAAMSHVSAPGDATAAIANPATSSTGSATAGAHKRGGHGHRGGGSMNLWSGKIATAIGLSDAQKASIKAIMTAGRPAKGAAHDPSKKAAMQAARANAKKILASDPLDTAGLTALLADRQTKAAARMDQMVTKLTAIRAVLTAAQCTQLADLIDKQTTKMQGQGHHHAGGSADARPAPTADQQAKWAAMQAAHPHPQLTAAQKTALKALMTARRGSQKPGARLTAMSAFWRNGDASALKTALAPVDTTPQTIAFLSSLSAADRAKMGGMLLGGGGAHRGGFHRGGGHHKPGASPAPAAS